ncbi:hypothetical protein SRHO_G00267730 [Serrasalmus rhombeus]
MFLRILSLSSKQAEELRGRSRIETFNPRHVHVLNKTGDFCCGQKNSLRSPPQGKWTESKNHAQILDIWGHRAHATDEAERWRAHRWQTALRPSLGAGCRLADVWLADELTKRNQCVEHVCPPKVVSVLCANCERRVQQGRQEPARCSMFHTPVRARQKGLQCFTVRHCGTIRQRKTEKSD